MVFGFTYIYLSNESNTTHNVYFDDLRITHTKGQILQEDRYYPFGANISALSSTAPLSKPNNFKYNGFEEQTDFDLGWYDYLARQYDPQLGRFLSIDPMADLMRRHSPYNYAFDNPIGFIDPDWMNPEDKVEDTEVVKTHSVDLYTDPDGVQQVSSYTEVITTSKQTDDEGNVTYSRTIETAQVTNSVRAVKNDDGSYKWVV